MKKKTFRRFFSRVKDPLRASRQGISNVVSLAERKKYEAHAEGGQGVEVYQKAVAWQLSFQRTLLERGLEPRWQDFAHEGFLCHLERLCDDLGFPASNFEDEPSTSNPRGDPYQRARRRCFSSREGISEGMPRGRIKHKMAEKSVIVYTTAPVFVETYLDSMLTIMTMASDAVLPTTLLPISRETRAVFGDAYFSLALDLLAEHSHFLRLIEKTINQPVTTAPGVSKGTKMGTRHSEAHAHGASLDASITVTLNQATCLLLEVMREFFQDHLWISGLNKASDKARARGPIPLRLPKIIPFTRPKVTT